MAMNLISYVDGATSVLCHSNFPLLIRLEIPDSVLVLRVLLQLFSSQWWHGWKWNNGNWNDAICGTDGDTLVSVQVEQVVLPSVKDATNVAQPRAQTLASSNCSYCCSAPGSVCSTFMPDGGTVKLKDTYMICKYDEQATSDCSGVEVEIELFDAGRLPSIEAEAPQCLDEAGRNNTCLTAFEISSCTSREQRMSIINDLPRAEA